jgi:hypothetical protein
MNYASGEPVRLGDDVDLGQGQFGQVVGIIQERRYRTGYNGADWEYLGKGILQTKTWSLSLEIRFSLE